VSTCSTHVLDAALGRPAAGIAVLLTSVDAALAEAVTDADGRVRFDADLAPGDYRLTFATGPWFAKQQRKTFYPGVTLHVTVEPGQEHYHVALLLSPFSYTTYRGS
jgi:5-hydroxyisourate hydrolase